ncbi:hypothetical protein JXL21_04495 [Candidatus Bathyarchaeota archaeon]|nr:hypothetical protein [Candidatus Bathyarchaeota archaeon]
MEDLKRFSEAIKTVERYEQYLYQRAMGLALIVNGLVGPAVFFMVLKADSFSVLLDMTPTMFAVASTILLAGVGILANIYLFASARVLSSRRSGRDDNRDLPFMVLMFSIWFVAFFLVGYIPEPFTGVGWSLAGGAASLVSYVVLSYAGHQKRRELLIIGVINILASLPVFLYGGYLEVEVAVLAVYAVSFVCGGVYSAMNAGRLLEAA